MENENKADEGLDPSKGFQVPIEGMLGIFAFGAKGILLWKEAKRLHAEQLESKLENSENKNEEE